MSAGWEVGDLALCVNAVGAKRISTGAVYTVTDVEVARPPWPDAGALGLHLAEARSNAPSGAYYANRFVKVTPPAADEFDRETIELMNRTPAKEPVA